MFWSVNIIWSCWWYWWVWHPWLNCIRYNINQGAISAWSAWVFLVQGHHNLEDSKRRANKEFFFIQILRPPTSPPFGKNFWKASFFYDNFLSDFGKKNPPPVPLLWCWEARLTMQVFLLLLDLFCFKNFLIFEKFSDCQETFGFVLHLGISVGYTTWAPQSGMKGEVKRPEELCEGPEGTLDL